MPEFLANRKVKKLKIVTPTEFLKDVEKLKRRTESKRRFYLDQNLIKEINELIKIRNLFSH